VLRYEAWDPKQALVADRLRIPAPAEPVRGRSSLQAICPCCLVAEAPGLRMAVVRLGFGRRLVTTFLRSDAAGAPSSAVNFVGPEGGWPGGGPFARDFPGNLPFDGWLERRLGLEWFQLLEGLVANGGRQGRGP